MCYVFGMSLRITTKKITNLIFDPANARSHSEQNLEAIKRSLETFGQRKPIVLNSKDVVVAGNGTLQAARDLGWTEIDTVSVPEDWTEEQVKAFAIADNRTAELADWNSEQLSLTLSDLEDSGWDLKDLGFTKTELKDLLTEAEHEANLSDGDAYTQTINVPQYEIVGDKPELADLADRSKTDRLKAQIEAANLPKDLEAFLLLAANRHTVFNYRKIAEYYPHAPKEVQELMENSALIIIDANDAIRNGYANFAAAISELEGEDSLGA